MFVYDENCIHAQFSKRRATAVRICWQLIDPIVYSFFLRKKCFDDWTLVDIRSGIWGKIKRYAWNIETDYISVLVVVDDDDDQDDDDL